jgi:hypothetical protein
VPEYNVHLEHAAASEGLAHVTTVRGGYTDSRQLRVGDVIPEGKNDPTLTVGGVSRWQIRGIGESGALHCQPCPTEAR